MLESLNQHSGIQIVQSFDPVKENNLKDITKDFLEGEESLYNEYLKGIDVKLVKKALDTVLNNPHLTSAQKVQLLTRSWSIVYRTKPPSVQEFLSPKYLGATASDANLYPRVRTVIEGFMHPNAEYRNLIMSCFIGFGKSSASVLISLYVAVLISLMRDAKKFFGLSPASVLCQVLISYSLKKSSEVLLEPFLNILETASFFERSHTRESMIKRDKDFEEAGENISKIFWTTASPSSALQFSNGANIKLISSVQNLLGLTVVTAVLSELAFFIDAGKSHEYIMRFYFDTRSRIESRMKGNWFGRSILDSSPNSLDNPIDKYIWQEAPKDPTNYIVTGSRWDWAPEDFKNVEDTFPLFLGAPGVPPSIPDEDTVRNNLKDHDPTTLLWVPRELKTIFENDIVKALKDVAGRPSGDQKKLLNENAIIENIFEEKLNNLYTHIYVPALLPPEHAIWEMVYPYFFRQVGENLVFYYRPEIPRVFSIDLAEKGDSASISIAHTELIAETSEIMTVYDLTIVISPLKGDINLDAIKYFIEDCATLGNMSFIAGSFDQFQSVSSRQHLERLFKFKINRVSVDLTMDPYKNFITDIRAGRVKVGRNIYIKNNLKSLIITPRRNSKKLKIDHTIGEAADIEGDSSWETSLIGYHAKDATDAMCQASELLKQQGVPAHFHNNFMELVSQKTLLEDDENYYEFLEKENGLQRAVKYH